MVPIAQVFPILTPTRLRVKGKKCELTLDQGSANSFSLLVRSGPGPHVHIFSCVQILFRGPVRVRMVNIF